MAWFKTLREWDGQWLRLDSVGSDVVQLRLDDWVGVDVLDIWKQNINFELDISGELNS